VLDRVFQALANPTRRSVLEDLRRGPRTTKELAEPYDMALPSFMQHLEVLEESGLIRSRKVGRIRAYEARPERLRAAKGWLARQREMWEDRFDQLDRYLGSLKEND
jgi:DNA-binding transcriptional ArsR family regulator